jgi:hypothetical protein
MTAQRMARPAAATQQISVMATTKRYWGRSRWPPGFLTLKGIGVLCDIPDSPSALSTQPL